MTFFRLFFGFLLQVLPFSALSFQPYMKYARFSKRITILLTLSIILCLAAIFSGCGIILQKILPPDNTLFRAMNLVFMLALLPCFLCYAYIIKTCWSKKLFIFSFTLSAALIVTTISNAITNYISMPGTYDGLPYFSWTIPVLFALTVVFVPFFSLLLRFCYQPLENNLTVKETAWLSILSLIQFLVLTSGLSFISYSSLYNPLSVFLFFALFATVFLLYVSFYKLLQLSHEHLIVQQEYDRTRHLLALQAEQYRHICENIEGSRRLRHDMRHHMVAIQGYLQNNEIASALNYVERCMEQAKQYESAKYCDNSIINTMLSYYQLQATERDVNLSIHISAPTELQMHDEDISIIIGNLLENALYAAAQTAQPNRYIQFNMILSGKMLAITVDNSFNGIIRMDGEYYLSTKPQHDGIGLKSIRHIAEKYHGGVEFTHDSRSFHASVMLCME